MNTIVKLSLITLFIISFTIMSSALVFATPQLIEATGAYTIGDGLNENISVAKERAKAEALRNASEKASVFVESLSVVKEGMVTKDEIGVISANIMQIQGTPKFKAIPVSDDVIRYECFVTVAVDTDNINAAMIKDKSALAAAVEKNKQLTGEIERLNGEMEKLKNRYKTAST